MKIYLQYLKYVLRHKLFVLVAGLRLDVPLWRLILHDVSKFSRNEFVPYALRFFSGRSSDERVLARFDLAWLNHENRNPHHFGYWIPRTGRKAGSPLPMPETFVREMLADWAAVSRAKSGEWYMEGWLNTELDRRSDMLHPLTVQRIEKVLAEMGYVRDLFRWVHVDNIT